MNELISHIEFLLHGYDCVIVPNLGGFVVNNIAAKREGISAFHMPACELVFNRELTYNDGLLVQSYMKTDNISFDEATKKVEDSVKQLRHELRETKKVDLGDLGMIRMNNESQFIYTPKPFIRPQFFGLSHVALKPIIQLQPNTVSTHTPKQRKSVLRNIGISAAAAVVLAFVMFLLPVQDNPLQKQYAQIFSESGWFGNRAQSTTHTEVSHSNNLHTKASENKVAEKTNIEQFPTLPQTNMENAEIIVSPNEKKYYIVVGVYEVRESAEKIAAQLIHEGFSQTGQLERSGRVDVYLASFSNQADAEAYQREVHQKYPSLRDAWVLKY